MVVVNLFVNCRSFLTCKVLIIDGLKQGCQIYFYNCAFFFSLNSYFSMALKPTSAGLEPVLTHSPKSSIASYYRNLHSLSWKKNQLIWISIFIFAFDCRLIAIVEKFETRLVCINQSKGSLWCLSLKAKEGVSIFYIPMSPPFLSKNLTLLFYNLWEKNLPNENEKINKMKLFHEKFSFW